MLPGLESSWEDEAGSRWKWGRPGESPREADPTPAPPEPRQAKEQLKKAEKQQDPPGKEEEEPILRWPDIIRKDRTWQGRLPPLDRQELPEFRGEADEKFSLKLPKVWVECVREA